ncbi:MAG: GNAT family N-acetyltransferase [Anaerolineales bacterium]|nr:GNAT family N-acetyltransferase [Anaerolineales bacterium]
MTLGMQLDIVRDPAVFDVLKDEWNDLLARGVSRTPFQRAEYQRAWWEHRGGGEWPEAELCVVVARDAGRLVGIAPLFAATNREGRRALLFVGSIEISDYLDFVVACAELDDFCAALLERLTQPDVPPWEVLDLYNLPAASPTRAALGRAAAARGWAATEMKLQPCPVIPLPGDWETYLNTQVEKKERQEIRRKLRRAEGGEQRVTWRLVGADDDLAAEADAFLDLMALTPDKASFLTPAMRAQFRAIVCAAAGHGYLHLTFLEVDGVRAAAYLSFDFGNRLYVYNSAIDPRFNALSVGWVLLAYLLRWSIANKRTAFDFMRGGEDYKLRFGGVPAMIYRVQISAKLHTGDLGGESLVTANPGEAEFFPN